MIGKTVGHYQIEEKIGEGGMGVVYRAEDTRLKRTVALKFLPQDLTRSAEARERFIHEAQAASALDHPNICTIYEIDETDEGQVFIVMGLYEGQTLREKISERPLKLEDAIDITSQIAQGLAKAHEQKIIHRDIKPANIFITNEGQVKVLDFGVAKLAGSTKLTLTGTTLGTVSYMAPEQAKGDEADHKADIWSLGVLMYEMLTGQQPFKGEHEQAVIYSILNEEPEPITALRTGIPVDLEWIVQKALKKDPALRYQHIDEIPVDLMSVEERRISASRVSAITLPSEGVATPSKIKRFKPLGVRMLIAGLALIGGISVGWLLKPRPVPIQQPINRFTITPSQMVNSLAISRDGKYLVYVVKKDDESTQLFLRPMDAYYASPLPDTKNANKPFFSPDGRWIGFVADGKLKKILLAGGGSVTICEVLDWAFTGAFWGTDDRIIFGNLQSGLMRISASGGTPELITKPDTDKGETGHQYPYILPGGRAVLFSILRSPNIGNSQIALLSFETNESRILLNEEGTNARYIDTGHIVFIRSGMLMAFPFDLRNLKVTASLFLVLEDVLSRSPIEDFSISSKGILVYIPSITAQEQSLVWVDRDGQATPIMEERGSFRWPRISPDGKRIAFGENNDIWVYDVERGSRIRLTLESGNGEPVWTPDGKRVTFWSTRSGDYDLYWKSSDGIGGEEPLLIREHYQYAVSWSPDGRNLAFYQNTIHNFRCDIWVLHLEGESLALLETPFNERLPMFSPDGRWLAYVSDETGRNEVYVQPYPDFDKRVLVLEQA